MGVRVEETSKYKCCKTPKILSTWLKTLEVNGAKVSAVFVTWTVDCPDSRVSLINCGT